MHSQPLERAEGPIYCSLWVFYDILRRGAWDLVLAAGEVVKMRDEAERILQQGRSSPSPLSSSSSSAAAAAAEVVGVGVTAEACPWSSEGFPVPTLPLFLGVAVRLESFLHPHKNSRVAATATATASALGDRATLESLVVLVKLMCWYCLATARPQLSAAGESPLQAGGGRSTLLQRLPRRPNGMNATTTTNSSSNNNHCSNANTTSGGGSSADAGSESHDVETQVAEEMFRLAVDVVFHLSTCEIRQVERDVEGSVSGAEDSADLFVELRVGALYLLATVLLRFRSTPFNAMQYLPTLFLEVDARDPRATHPLLTPLLWDPEERVRKAAAVLVSSLLRKLQQSFKYAEEPQRKRQSFSSLASQSGRVLALLHDVLLWALQVPGAAPTAPPVSRYSKGLILSLFGSLVTFTPYHRCPHAFQVVRQALELPFLRGFLLDDACDEFSPAAAFLGQVFKTDSLANMVRMQLSCEGMETNNDASDSRQCDSSRCVGAGVTLLESLLSHAAKRVDVWRCVVQLSRIHPSVVGAHFPRLIEASRAVLCASCEACGNGNTNTGTEANAAAMRGDTLGECLRTWLHFMGYVWQSFDGCPADPAFRQEHAAHRATPYQKEQIMLELVMPSLLLTSDDLRLHDARQTALRCVAQVGDEHLSSLSQTVRGQIVAQVLASTMSHEGGVRAEAFTTVGVWAWQYSALGEWMPDFVDRAVNALWSDENAVVRFKAAFALSNITSRLGEEPDSSLLRQSPHHMQLLCDVAMHATEAHGEPAVVGHGIRMMSHLLRCLTFEELIGELSEDQVGVAEGFFGALLHFLQPFSHDAKLRWNAACALGVGFSREVVFEAEPRGAFQAVERLCVLVRHDRVFKVRTQAATALAKVPMICLAAGRYSTEDLTPKVARTLCDALQASSGSTENFTQYKEQKALCAALRNALTVLITSAAPSDTLQRVFAEFRVLLETEGLL